MWTNKAVTAIKALIKKKKSNPLVEFNELRPAILEALSELAKKGHRLPAIKKSAGTIKDREVKKVVQETITYLELLVDLRDKGNKAANMVLKNNGFIKVEK